MNPTQSTLSGVGRWFFNYVKKTGSVWSGIVTVLENSRSFFENYRKRWRKFVTGW